MSHTTKLSSGEIIIHNSDFSGDIVLKDINDGFATEVVIGSEIVELIGKHFSEQARLSALKECREIAEERANYYLQFTRNEGIPATERNRQRSMMLAVKGVIQEYDSLISKGGEFGIEPGYVVFSLDPVDSGTEAKEAS